MIILCGIPSEEPLKLAINAAEKMGVNYLVFNQRHAQFNELSLRINDNDVNGTMCIQGTEITLAEITGFYVRLMDHHMLPENKPRWGIDPDHIQVTRSNLLHTTLTQLLEVTPSKVMNRASAMASNMSKPYQARICQSAGFKVPLTLISNRPDEVRAFRAQHGRIIYKSISAVRSIVKELDNDSLADLDRIRALPTQFQAYVPGTDIRVHVAGSHIYPAEVCSEAIDYRYASQEGLETKMAPVKLPDDIAQRCLNLSRELNLPLCGIDLRRTPDGEYYCFEVNPSPAYSYYQSQTDLPISEGIIHYLADL